LSLETTRRFFLASAVASGAGLYSRLLFAMPVTKPSNEESPGGFRYLYEAGSPFSIGVSALAGNRLVRVRLQEPIPIETGLDLVACHLARLGRPLSALAGLELRAPSVMSRPQFSHFNENYLAALRARGFTADRTVPIARSNMVPQFDPPATHVLSAFTYAVPDESPQADGPDFLMSGRPEFDENHVVAPGDVSTDGMRRKANFVLMQLRQGVADLGGRLSSITGIQIYMTQPLTSVMEVMRDAGLTRFGLTLISGSAPVIGFDGVPYEFEADLRCISFERVIRPGETCAGR